MFLAFSLAFATETAPTTETAAATTPTAADGTTPAPVCSVVTVNADGTKTRAPDDAALPDCGPDGKPVTETKGKKKLEKSNTGRMEAEETRE